MIKRTLFFENKCSLTLKYEQLVVKTVDREKTIPIEDIGFIVIENQETYISIPALSKLSSNNVSVIFCDNKHMPQACYLI
jgi:CRISPR-associated protein Cas1